MIARLATRVRALTGWRAHGLVLVAGLIGALALPPVYGSPILLAVFPVLIWRMDTTRGWRGAFALGWLFGLGYFMGMTHWVGAAMLVDIAAHGWLAPIAVVGLAAILGLFPAVALALVRPVWWAGHPARVLVMAAAWGLGEWIRTWGLTGFPWAPLGMTWMPFEGILQSASWFGVLGLSLVTALVACVPVLLEGGLSKRTALILVLLALSLPLDLEGLGWARLVRLEGAGTGDEAPLLIARLVQPSIAQKEKWNRELMVGNLRRYIAMSRLPGMDKVDVVIWGETAVPYAIDRMADVRAALAQAVPPGGYLITGAPRVTGEGETRAFWNSLFALDGTGAVVAMFDKFHLVPFGEYVPLGDYLPLGKITAGAGDFSPGPGPRTVTIGDLPPLSPLICYEVIFPGAVVNRGDGDPQWLLNLTNDGWYGRTSGPYQHFEIARMRAIEEGLPIVRVANTGISGVVSPLGRVLSRLGLYEEGILDVAIPRPLQDRTLFSYFGNRIFLALMVIFGGLGIFLSRKNFSSTRFSRT
ncbi:MAG: apolipoprotein N-acyltransferase [Rhodospirillum sp.]|nr:apolipoprotein N-acyltransferase [Rhodospirillum sp.]MCF8487977.1 apolipoprotein N-acyltransferase [Rhodospirillum sp.]MCF8499324.1 apolipoprotein N-acyltransferase [Rhodospirillum sp.]